MKIPINWLKDYVKLPSDIKPLTDKLTMVGHMLDGVTESGSGKTIDLELRGNRADCYSIIGIAREVAAITKTKATIPPVFSSSKKVKELKNVKLKVNTPYVKRVVMATITGVKIEPSPKWLTDKLKAYGLESINNIVDLTNFVTIELGQPMHAFDQDKVGSKLEIRLAKKKEKILTFQGTTIGLNPDDLVWANDKSVLSLAGAIGEKTHSISDDTKNILLEAASYDRANIRRSIHRHSLFTEAGIRHEKELDPNLVDTGVNRFLYLIDKHRWGRVNTQYYDYYPRPVKPWKIKLAYKHLYTISGITIPPSDVKDILSRLNFKIEKATSSEIEVLVPTYRTDVTLPEDLIEEVIRIYGYDKIEPRILSLAIPAVVTPPFINQELTIKNEMAGLGFDEIISSSFVKENVQNLNTPTEIRSTPVALQNPPSPDLTVMRTTLLPNLFEIAKKAKDERARSIYFFEVGKTYVQKGSKYVENRKLGVIYWEDGFTSYKKFKGYLEALFIKINLRKINFDNSINITTLKSAYEITLAKKTAGFGGVINGYHYAEVDLEKILTEVGKPSVNLWPKYPPQIEDITFKLPDKTKVGEVLTAILQVKSVANSELVDVFKDAHTFRIWYQDANKTLESKEVEALRKEVIERVRQKFGGWVN